MPDTPLSQEFIDAVLRRAMTKVDLFPNEERVWTSSFWEALTNKSEARIKLHQFFNTASNYEISSFYDFQNVVFDAVDQDVLKIEAPLQAGLEAVHKKYISGGGSRPRLMDYIRSKPTLFRANPAVSIILDYVPFALSLTDGMHAKNATEFGTTLAYHLRTDKNWDITPGRATQLLGMWMSENDKSYMAELYAANTHQQKGKVKVRAMQPEGVKSVPDAHIEFLRETGPRGAGASKFSSNPYSVPPSKRTLKP